MKVQSDSLGSTGGGMVLKKNEDDVGKKPANKKKWRKAVEDDDNNEVASNLSDLSDSTETDESQEKRSSSKKGGGDRAANGTSSQDYENFEKTLRNKHSKACKAMSVRVLDCVARECWCREFGTIYLHICPACKHWSPSLYSLR
jgi:hypothetical protein